MNYLWSYVGITIAFIVIGGSTLWWMISNYKRRSK